MRQNINLRRRCVAFGLVATTLCGLVPELAAQERDAPIFRSGRYQFTLLRPTVTLPSVMLSPLRGKAIDLASLGGRPILVNFWATWCAACRIEMPILDRLAQKHRGSGLTIVAVSEDRAERAVVERFAASLSIHNLNIYMDPNSEVAFTDAANKRKAPFALYGMPITYAVTASGQVIGYMPGAADWESPDGRQLIEFLSYR